MGQQRLCHSPLTELLPVSKSNGKIEDCCHQMERLKTVAISPATPRTSAFSARAGTWMENVKKNEM
jgi:hypothetical protein